MPTVSYTKVSAHYDKYHNSNAVSWMEEGGLTRNECKSKGWFHQRELTVTIVYLRTLTSI